MMKVYSPNNFQTVAEIRSGVGHNRRKTKRDGSPADIYPILALLRLQALTDRPHQRVVDGVPQTGGCKDDCDMPGLQTENIGVEKADVQRDALEHQIHRKVDGAVTQNFLARDFVVAILR